MPKMKLTYKFDETEKGEAWIHINAHVWHGALWDIDTKLRSILKHSENLPEETRTILEELRSEIPHLENN